jgi:ABC-2 type transport system ATP-binding protein
MSALALNVSGLSKRFDRPVVDRLDLRVRAGEFYVLLGPNGAGKTTILRMVAGLTPPDAGSISVCGIDTAADPVAAKRLVAWVSDEPMVYDRLTPLEYLEFVAGLWQVDALTPKRRARPARLARPSARMPTSAVAASPRACCRRWRWPAPWCMTRASSSSTSR